MTTGQYEKATQIYRYITSLKDQIATIKDNSMGVRVEIRGCETNQYFYDQVIAQDIEAYVQINELAIRAEVLDVLKDHLARLEGELETI